MSEQTEMYQEVGLDNLSEGAAIELFSRDLKKVVENFMDPNCDSGKKRSITLTVTFAPKLDTDGNIMNIGVQTASKASLAPTKGVTSLIYPVTKNGKAIAVASKAKIQDLFKNEPTPLKAVAQGE